jgi:hypothetical protein
VPDDPRLPEGTPLCDDGDAAEFALLLFFHDTTRLNGWRCRVSEELGPLLAARSQQGVF